jgi:HD superfamily phosphohydrolase
VTTTTTSRWSDVAGPHRDADLDELLGTDLTQHPWVTRLASISFLGTLDHHPRAVSTSSRLAHSIGVAQHGLRTARVLALSSGDKRALAAVCLLHDVGHYPYSHSVEGAFARVTGADHHALTRAIIGGGDAVPRHRSLAPVLAAIGVSPDRIMALISGEPSEPLGQLLVAPINLDTLEGIPRAAASFGIAAQTIPDDVFVYGPDGLSVPAHVLPATDAFWRLKERVYEDVINSPSNILFELQLSTSVEATLTADIIESFQTFTDDAFRERFLSNVSPRQFERLDRDYVFASSPGAGP